MGRGGELVPALCSEDIFAVGKEMCGDALDGRGEGFDVRE